MNMSYTEKAVKNLKTPTINVREKHISGSVQENTK